MENIKEIINTSIAKSSNTKLEAGKSFFGLKNQMMLTDTKNVEKNHNSIVFQYR